MQPIDYTIDIANPMQSVLQGYQLGQQMQQQRQQQIAAQQKKQAFASLIRPDATFADYQKVMQAYPDEAKALGEQWNAMDKIQRDLMFNAGGEAYSLIRTKEDGTVDATAAVSKLQEYAAAAENSGDKARAKQFSDMAEFVKVNPAAGKATIGSVLSVWDADRAKGVLGAELGPIDTAAVKNLIAEGLTPGTPEFQAALRDERRKVTVTLPNGGFFSGSPEKLQEILGGAIPANAQVGSLPRPQSKEEYDAIKPGQQYIYTDGTMRTKPGGPTQPASGGFQPRP
jgi:hypothetical protein